MTPSPLMTTLRLRNWGGFLIFCSLILTPPQSWAESTLVSQARLYLEEGYPERAIELLENAIRDGSEESVVASLLAQIYYDQFRLEDAFQALNRARRLASVEEERQELRSLDESWRTRYGVLNLQLLGGGEGMSASATLSRKGRLLNQHKRSVFERAQRLLERGLSLPTSLWLPHGQYTLTLEESDNFYPITLSAEASSFSLELPHSGPQIGLESGPVNNESRSRTSSLLYWGIGGVALAVAISVFFLQPEEQEKTTSYQLSFE